MMTKGIHLAVLAICLLSLLGCKPKVDPELQTQVEIEAYEFEQLLKESASNVATLTYPHDRPYRPILPEGWETGPGGLLWIQIREADTHPTCSITINHNKLTPFGPSRVVLRWHGSRRYWVKTHQSIDLTDILPQFRDGGTDYDLRELAGQMFEANPYVEKTALEEHKTPPIEELVDQMRGQILTVYEDIDDALEFVTYLETKYFEPNACAWDTQDELAAYRESMVKSRAQLAQIESDLTEITDWDFSNLERLRAQQGKEFELPEADTSAKPTPPATTTTSDEQAAQPITPEVDTSAKPIPPATTTASDEQALAKVPVRSSPSFAAVEYTNSDWGFSVMYPVEWAPTPSTFREIDFVAQAATMVPVLFVDVAEGATFTEALTTSMRDAGGTITYIGDETETTLADGTPAFETKFLLTFSGFPGVCFALGVPVNVHWVCVIVCTVDMLVAYDQEWFSEIAHTLRFE